jgi:anaerobic magnesium-protoporphyrin IX monomethyl ester cyclase
MNNLDVLLINAPSPNPGSILSHRVQGLPPLGICYIATFLNSKGYRAGLLDFYIRSVSMKDLLNSMNRDKPGIIGISTTTETYKSGMRLAGVIKQLSPSATVVMGGCHVTFEYEEALSSGNVDYAVRGEGEITFYELCNYLLRGEGDLKNINGISYMQDGRVVSNPAREFICDLDSLPFPDRSLFDLDKYSYPASISTSRGCPGRCIFCAAAALSGGR